MSLPVIENFEQNRNFELFAQYYILNDWKEWTQQFNLRYTFGRFIG